MALIYALGTVLGWGTWLAAARNVRSANPHGKVLFATLANLAVSGLVYLVAGGPLSFRTALLPFLGGAVWSIAGVFAFRAADRLGLARGVGIWVSLNIIAGLVWGALLFGELAGLGVSVLAAMGLGLLILIGGVILMSGAKRSGDSAANFRGGLLDAAIAGILWGSYFIPLRTSGLPLPSAALPMALGMAVTSLLFALAARKPLSLQRPRDYAMSGLSGALWALGNYSMLLLAGRIGTGRGFAIAQLNMAVSALIGVFLFREVEPGSPAARRVLLGTCIATAGAMLFGLVR